MASIRGIFGTSANFEAYLSFTTFDRYGGSHAERVRITNLGTLAINAPSTNAYQVGAPALLIYSNKWPSQATAGAVGHYVIDEGGTNTVEWTVDQVGNHEQQSAHVDGDVPVRRSWNEFTGRAYFRNDWTGEEKRFWVTPTRTWENYEAARHEKEITPWRIAKAQRESWLSMDLIDRVRRELTGETAPPDPGPQPTRRDRPPPAWLRDALEVNSLVDPVDGGRGWKLKAAEPVPTEEPK